MAMQSNPSAGGPPGPRSGVLGLDEVLRGGLKPGALHLIQGVAGTGKSVLAHQLAFAVARRNGSVLYCTAPVESHQTLLDQARTFRFFEASAVATRLHYASMQPALERGGTGEVRRELLELTARYGPELVIVDGVHAFELFAEAPIEFHRLLVELQTQAAATGISVLLLSSRTEPSNAWPSVPDVVIELCFERRHRRRIRTLEVLKLRGRSFLEGAHTVLIDDEGLRVLPRIEASVARDYRPITHSTEFLAFGTPTLDGMLGGGLTAGSVTLVSGAPGAGKTLLGLSFLSAGADAGQPGLLVGFHESLDRIIEKAEGIGLPFRRQIEEGSLHVHWRPSAEIVPDSVALETLGYLRRHGIRRLVIDALDDVLRGFADPERGLAFLNAFLHLARNEQIGVILTEDIRRVFARDIVIPIKNVSAAVDNIILLRYAERGGDLHRFLSILKLREHDYDTTVREFTIGSEGFQLRGAFDARIPDRPRQASGRARRET